MNTTVIFFCSIIGQCSRTVLFARPFFAGVSRSPDSYAHARRAIRRSTVSCCQQLSNRRNRRKSACSGGQLGGKLRNENNL